MINSKCPLDNTNLIKNGGLNKTTSYCPICSLTIWESKDYIAYNFQINQYTISNYIHSYRIEIRSNNHSKQISNQNELYKTIEDLILNHNNIKDLLSNKINTYINFQ